MAYGTFPQRVYSILIYQNILLAIQPNRLIHKFCQLDTIWNNLLRKARVTSEFNSPKGLFNVTIRNP